MIKIFSTRSLPTSEKEKVAEVGIEIADRNFIRIVPVVDEQLKSSVFSALNKPGKMVLFTSKNAVRIAFENYLSVIPEKTLQSWGFYCISGATRTTLLRYVEPKQIKGSAHYASDLGVFLRETSGENEPIHFFCGNKRRNTLPDFMNSHHIPFKEWIIYENVETPSSIEDHYHGYLFYSPSAVKSFFSKNRIDIEKPCFTIGKTTANAVTEKIPNPVLSSPETNTPALLELLVNYFKKTYGNTTEE